jgi:high frequency lysogenization protein
MRLRIQVGGSGVYLQQPAIAQRIRCMLFVAIRSAFLWQQLGGTRIHLMLQRKTLVKLLPHL